MGTSQPNMSLLGAKLWSPKTVWASSRVFKIPVGFCIPVLLQTLPPAHFLKNLVSLRGRLRMTASSRRFLNAVEFFSLVLNKKNGKIHKIFSLINPIVHCTGIPYYYSIISHPPEHFRSLREVDKKATYKPQHDSVNYNFNVDTRNLCNVSQQASNQGTWKTSPTLKSPNIQ